MEQFLIVIFPAEKTDKARAELARRFAEALAKACAEPPLYVWPDHTKFVLLAQGEPGRIIMALRDAAAIDTRYLAVPAGSGYASSGLSSAALWLDRRS